MENSLSSLLKELESFITTKTVVGEPIHIADTILVPLVDVSFGVGTGAKSSATLTEKDKDKERSLDGPVGSNAGGLGAHITPSAMLVIQNGTTQLINIKGQDSLTKLIDMVPGLMANIPDLVNQVKTRKTDKTATVAEVDIDFDKDLEDLDEI
ncbi:MAG: sporulation protein [Epulopiscium sp. Nele67-Bin004]|nr:MAG: sporulation protein [Epulopiscium sp. Nele67-Bin004]